MPELTDALLKLLPPGMDVDNAIYRVKQVHEAAYQEIKVLLYRCAANRDTQIAAELGLSVKTVRTYGNDAKWKLGFKACRTATAYLMSFLNKP